METAKIFWTGRSQAIRLPKNIASMAMRFESGGMVLQSYWNRFQLIGRGWMLYQHQSMQILNRHLRNRMCFRNILNWMICSTDAVPAGCK